MSVTITSGNRIHFLDGIRGWGALIVFYFHLIVKFLGSEFPEYQYLYSSILLDGHLAVLVFFVISGISLSVGPLTRGEDTLRPAIIARYMRLMLPILVTTMAGFALLKFGLNYNLEVAATGISEKWLGRFYDFVPGIKSAVAFSVYDVFFSYQSSTNYNSSLWTIQFELLGSFALYALFVTMKSLQMRRVIALISVGLLLVFSPYIACFFAGYLIADLLIHSRAKFSRNDSYIGSFLFLGACIAAWVHRPAQEWYWACVAIILTTGLILSQPLRSFMENRLSRFLGMISFPLYLSHIFVICTLSSWLYLVLPVYGFTMGEAFILNVALSSMVSLVVALFFVPTESFAMFLSRSISRLLLVSDRRFIESGVRPLPREIIACFMLRPRNLS